MKKIILIFICKLFVLNGFTIINQEENRWEINTSGGITWNIDSRLPHYDHIEMSGCLLYTSRCV